MRLFVAITLLALVGCAPATTYVHDIPNLRPIDKSFYRSGQPMTLDQWSYLHDVLGITDDLKLDFDDEGIDNEARLAGIVVHPLGILPTTDPDTVKEIVEGLLARPDHSRIVALKQLIVEIAADPRRRALIHCKNGHDRTGLASMLVRVLVDGWSKDAAWKEARSLGFHPELLGLVREWQDTKIP
jgi:protein tyrosine/serine phosphatase